MNTMMKTNKLVTTSMLVALLTVFSLLGTLPFFNTISLVVAPIIVALIYHRGGRNNTILSFVATMILVTVLMDPIYGITMTILNYSMGVGLVYMISKKKGPLANFVVLALAIAVGITAMFLIEIRFLTDYTLMEYIEVFVMDIKNALPSILEQVESLGGNVEDNAALTFFTNLTVKGLIMLLPSVLLMYAMISAAFVYKVSQVVFKRLGIYVTPLPRLSEIKSNMYLIMGSLFLSMIGILLVYTGFDYGEALMSLGNNIFSITGIIGGMSLLSYLMEVKLKYPTVFRIVILFLIFGSSLVSIIAIAGIIDSAFDFRKLTDHGLYSLLKSRQQQ